MRNCRRSDKVRWLGQYLWVASTRTHREERSSIRSWPCGPPTMESPSSTELSRVAIGVSRLQLWAWLVSYVNKTFIEQGFLLGQIETESTSYIVLSRSVGLCSSR